MKVFNFRNINLEHVTRNWLSISLIISVTRGEENNKAAVQSTTFQWCGNASGIITNSQSTPIFEIPESLSEDLRKFEIRLKPVNFSCPDGTHADIFYLGKDRHLGASLTHETEFSPSGFFRYDDFYYPPEAFCIAEWTKSHVAVRVCGKFSQEGSFSSLPDCGNSSHCIPKCCPMNTLLTSSADGHAQCEPSFNNSAWLRPILYTKEFQEAYSLKTVFFFIQILSSEGATGGALTAKNRDLRKLYYFDNHCARVVEDGTLYYVENFKWIQVPRTNYCLDGIQSHDASLDRRQHFHGQKLHYGFMINKNSKPSRPPWVAAVFISASVIFFLTLMVHLLLWKEQHIQGWLAMSEFATLCLSHLAYGMHILTFKRTRSLECIAIGVVRHFSYLSQYCWLTMICLNLFVAFRKLRIVKGDQNNVGSYLWYAGFGWGVPFLFVTISLILDQICSYDPCNLVMVPQYGVDGCTISGAALGPYLIYPLALLLTFNTVLFSVTTYKLHTYSKYSKIARENLNDSIKIYKIIAKLFFVMGITWIMSYLFNVLWKLGLGSMTGFWEMVSVVTYFQALGVFIIYCCNSSVSASLRERYPLLIRNPIILKILKGFQIEHKIIHIYFVLALLNVPDKIIGSFSSF